MAIGKTQYVERMESNNMNGKALYYGGYGVFFGGMAVALTGLGMMFAAENSRHCGYVDYEGEKHRVCNSIPPEMEPVFNASIGMLFGGIGLAAAGEFVIDKGKSKREDEKHNKVRNS